MFEKAEGLLKKGVVKPVPLDQERSRFYSTYFLVQKRDRGHRPILNLKFFNIIVRKTSFKMETLRSVIVMKPHQWMASVDLKDAYFHIRVVLAYCQYLRFQCLGQAYQFEALSFRLSSAPRVFIMTLAPLVAWLGLMRVQLYRYLNNILLLEQSVQTTLQVLT